MLISTGGVPRRINLTDASSSAGTTVLHTAMLPRWKEKINLQTPRRRIREKESSSSATTLQRASDLQRLSAMRVGPPHKEGEPPVGSAKYVIHHRRTLPHTATEQTASACHHDSLRPPGYRVPLSVQRGFISVLGGSPRPRAHTRTRPGMASSTPHT